MEEDIRFRIEAAAKVLERAARKASDRKLRSWLIEEADRLRRIANKGDLLELSDFEDKERVRTLDDIVEEIRQFIWSDFKKAPETKETKQDVEDPISKLEANIDRIIEEFDKRMKILDKLFEVLP